MKTLLTAEERKQWGRGQRRTLKRSAHSHWDAKKRNFEPLELLAAAERGRLPELLPIKAARMAVSPFGFFRGSVPLMAADLSRLSQTHIQVQLCGDAHVRNLGAFTGVDGRLVFDINDFDETIAGPFEWDLKRMATSLVLAGREAGNSERVCRDAVLHFAASYSSLMARLAAMPAIEVARFRIHRQFSGSAGNTVLHKAERCTPLHNLEKLMRARRERFKEHPPVLTHPSAAAARKVMHSLKEYRASLPPERQHILDLYRPVDFAFKVVGTGSVGVRDYVIFFVGNSPSDPLFLQVKEEPPSSYAAYLNSSGPSNQGQRVVEGQRRMQTHSDILLGWTSMDGRDYLVRQLADHKASIENEDLEGRGLMEYAHTCGEVLAKGHARSGDAVVVAGYLGSGKVFGRALAQFAFAYADQATLDYERFKTAIRSGRIQAARSTYN